MNRILINGSKLKCWWIHLNEKTESFLHSWHDLLTNLLCTSTFTNKTKKLWLWWLDWWGDSTDGKNYLHLPKVVCRICNNLSVSVCFTFECVLLYLYFMSVCFSRLYFKSRESVNFNNSSVISNDVMNHLRVSIYCNSFLLKEALKNSFKSSFL